MAAPGVLLYLARDLFFAVRIQEMGSRLGWTCVALEPVDDPAVTLRRLRPAVVLADLQAKRAYWTALLRAAATGEDGPVPSIAFGSHKDLVARAAALEAGATIVVANSTLTSDFAGLLARYAPAIADSC